ncbi:MAG: mechanosensitive ion channel domain-containing protein [Bacteroidota bacterium]
MLTFTHLYEILFRKITRWTETLVANLPNFVVAILIILLSAFVARYVRKIIVNLVERISHNVSLVSLAGLIVSRLVILVGIFIALGIVGLEKTVASLLAGAGIIGLALGFAFQDLTANLLSGIFITIGEPIRVGDIIETNGFRGKVKEIKIRSTILDNFAGQEIEIPSRRIFENPIINHSKIGGNQLQIQWKVSRKNDLDRVEKLTLDTVQALGFHDPESPLEFHYSSLDGDNITLVVSFWLSIGDPHAPSSPQATSDVIKAIKKAFDANEIS